MDPLSFIAAMFGSLAWPVVVLILALAFRGPIGRLVERLPKRVKAGPLEVEWPDVATEARVALATSPEGSRGTGRTLTERLRDLAEKDPHAAIVAAYAEVTHALWRHVSRGRGDIAKTEQRGGHLLIDVAQRRGIISEQTARAIQGLLVLRDLAAHGQGEVDREKALDYLTLADAVIFAIEANASARKLRKPAEDAAE